MAKQFSINQIPATGSEAIFLWKQFMKSIGWTVTRSGDTFSFSGSGDVITHGGIGAGGMNNTFAWFVLQAPTGTKQLQLQRNVTSLEWNVSYSFSAGFTGGAAAARASATDQKTINNGGGVGTPTLFTTDGTYRLHMMADDASPYGFYSVGIPCGGGLPTHIWMMDPMLESVSGDADPLVFYGDGGTSATNILGAYNAVAYGPLGNNTLSSVPPQAWRNKGGGSETFGPITGAFPFAYPFGTRTSLAGAYAHGNHLSGKRMTFPLFWCVPTSFGTYPGFKGTSSLLRVLLNPLATGSTLDFSSSKDRIVVGACTLPWNGTDPRV